MANNISAIGGTASSDIAKDILGHSDSIMVDVGSEYSCQFGHLRVPGWYALLLLWC